MTTNYKKFAKQLKENKKGLSPEDIKQSYVFRNIDLFRDNGKGLLPRINLSGSNLSARVDVLDIQNYNDGIANLSIYELLTRNSAVKDRKSLYSRSGFPDSSKENWASMSNNFKIFKLLKREKNENEFKNTETLSVEFPKFVKNDDFNTVISFKGISIDFEGTNFDTARSDVRVKIRFTMDSFGLLENYYDKNGNRINNSFDVEKHVRFLDLFTPPELSNVGGFRNSGIILEVYASDTSAGRAHKDTDEAKKNLNSICYGNHLLLNLYIIDHSMTFDEVTNKVDVEIEYRAAADVPKIFEEPESNILYSPLKRTELLELFKKQKDFIKNGCLKKSSEVEEEISKVKKMDFRQIVKENEAVIEGGFFVKRYEVNKGGDLVSDSGDEKVKSYSIDNFYTPDDDDDKKIGQNLRANEYPDMDDYFLSLHSLLVMLIPMEYDEDNGSKNKVRSQRVFLPYIPTGDVVGGGFHLGDLPINAGAFDDWYTKNYINKNIYFTDYKTITKDIILNYVLPRLQDAFIDKTNSPIELNISIKDIRAVCVPANFMGDTKSTRVPYSVLQSNTPLLEPSSTAGIFSLIIVYKDQGADFKAYQSTDVNSTGKILNEISKNFILLEAKSSYGPFKNIQLTKNDTDFIREIRTLQQGLDDISQLGAVYDASMETYPNCPDFRFFPGEVCFLYVPDFGLSTNTDNLAYKLGIGGHQVITNVSHTIDLEGVVKMSTKITMRYWASGVNNAHIPNTDEADNCPEETPEVEEEIPEYVPQPGSFGTFTPEESKEAAELIVGAIERVKNLF